MNYRDILISLHDHQQTVPDVSEPQILDYMGLRNLEAREAWQNRLRGAAVAVPAQHSRTHPQSAWHK